MGLRNPGAELDLRPEREPRTVRYAFPLGRCIQLSGWWENNPIFF